MSTSQEEVQYVFVLTRTTVIWFLHFTIFFFCPVLYTMVEAMTLRPPPDIYEEHWVWNERMLYNKFLSLCCLIKLPHYYYDHRVTVAWLTGAC